MLKSIRDIWFGCLREVGCFSKELLREVLLYLGHTNLIICFSDWVGKKRDPVGRPKKKKR